MKAPLARHTLQIFAFTMILAVESQDWQAALAFGSQVGLSRGRGGSPWYRQAQVCRQVRRRRHSADDQAGERRVS